MPRGVPVVRRCTGRSGQPAAAPRGLLGAASDRRGICRLVSPALDPYLRCGKGSRVDRRLAGSPVLIVCAGTDIFLSGVPYEGSVARGSGALSYRRLGHYPQASE